MIEASDPKLTDRPAQRCSECDREMAHYNRFLAPTGEFRVVCWECQAREEKGFFAKRNFRRGARTGYIPR